MAPRKLGKYRIGRRLARGGFADVHRAYDTVEGIPVALKIPYPHLLQGDAFDDFRREVRLTAKLDHPHILPIKNADWIDGQFVIVYPLGERSLGDRMRSRISLAKALWYSEQMLSALAHAHSRRVIHCDVKPDNLILFGGDVVKLTDFGIAKLALRTMRASGSGTVGYVAPEQAMGRPSFRSDVFSAGLIMYRMLSGSLPEWPYEWPPPGYERLKRRTHPDLLALIVRSIELDPYARYENARQMLHALQAIRGRTTRPVQRKNARRPTDRARDWRAVRRQQFLRLHRRELGVQFECGRCGGPMSEPMNACPWCGADHRVHHGGTSFPAECPRCRRGVKLDWRYCAWCYGGLVGPLSTREFSDRRYVARCPNRSCPRRELMPWSRYCPWCRAKVRRPWTIAGSDERCSRCRWGVVRDYWRVCPWCAKPIASKR